MSGRIASRTIPGQNRDKQGPDPRFPRPAISRLWRCRIAWTCEDKVGRSRPWSAKATQDKPGKPLCLGDSRSLAVRRAASPCRGGRRHRPNAARRDGVAPSACEVQWSMSGKIQAGALIRLRDRADEAVRQDTSAKGCVRKVTEKIGIGLCSGYSVGCIVEIRLQTERIPGADAVSSCFPVFLIQFHISNPRRYKKTARNASGARMA